LDKDLVPVKIEISIHSNQPKLLHFEGEIYGHLYECPFQKRNADCPFNEIDHLTFKEAIFWIKSLSLEKKESIMEHLMYCPQYRKRK